MLLVGEEVVRLEGDRRRAAPGRARASSRSRPRSSGSSRESEQPDPAAGRDRAAPAEPRATPSSARPRGAASIAYEEVAAAALGDAPGARRRAPRALDRGPDVRALPAPPRDRRRRRHRPRRGAADDRARSPGRRRIASPVILAIDQGTTGTTCLVFDGEGRIAGRAYSEFEQHFPRPGWVEHDATEIWEVTPAGRAPRRSPTPAIDGRRARGDRDHQPARDRRRLGPGDSGEPIHRALVWQDRRTAERCAELRAAGHEALVRERTGLVLDPYFSGDQDRVAAAQRRGGRAGGLRHDRLLAALQADRPPRHRLHQRLADDALRHPPPRLGRGALRRCSASTRRACPSRCPRPTSSARPPSSAARCRSPASPATSRRRSSARPATAPGRRRTPTAPAASSSSTPAPRPPSPVDGLLTTVACEDRRGRRPPTRSRPRSSSPAPPCSGCATGSGSSTRRPETEALAASLEGNDGVYFVPALTGLGSPHWDPYARGTIVGLTRGSGRAHLARAALEAIAYQTVDAVRAQEAAAGERLAALKADGGAVANALADAVPGRRARRPGGRPRDRRDDRARRRLPGRDRDRRAGPRSRSGRCGARPPATSRRWARTSARRCSADWRRALERSRGWAVPDGEPRNRRRAGGRQGDGRFGPAICAMARDEATGLQGRTPGGVLRPVPRRRPQGGRLDLHLRPRRSSRCRPC